MQISVGAVSTSSKIHKKTFAFFFGIAAGITALCLCAACAKPPPPQMEFVMGTVCGVNLFGEGSNKLYAKIFSRVREIDRTMGARPTDFQKLLDDGFTTEGSAAAQAAESAVSSIVSGIVRINESAGIAPVKTRPDLLALLLAALRYADLSGGAFDPTIGPLVNLWGIGTENARIPSDDEIAAALALVNWRDLIIDQEAGTVFLRQPGMALDLGAIAKGYAADEAARLAIEGGVKHGLFDFGGNIVVVGCRDNGRGRESAGQPWRIGIQDPLNERGNYLGVVPARDKSIVTSGGYERYFESGDRRYHHILSTADGWPIENGLLSVTIVCARSIDADALSTSVFALGYEKGRALVETLAGTEAIFAFSDHSVRITDGLRDTFTLTNDDYTLEE